MMGTSLLSVPWALSQSGLVMGLAIAIGMSLIAAYTASIILKTHSKESKNIDHLITPDTQFQEMSNYRGKVF